MANLIKSFHPHHQKDIITFIDLNIWIESFFSNRYVLYKKWDGISTSISLDIDNKKLGIKRYLNKKPFNISYINEKYKDKPEAYNCFLKLIDTVNKNKKIFDILKLNLNPNIILLIEYIKPSLNIISYSEEVYNIIGISEYKGSLLIPRAVEESVYINICNQLNSFSNIKFVYSSNIDIDLSMYKKSFYESLKEKLTIKNIKLSQSLYDILLSEHKINFSYKNVYKKKINTCSIKHYNNEEFKFSHGLAATEIIILLGEFVKTITKNQDLEGFIFYDYEKQIYLKLVGNFIRRLKESNFSNKKENNNIAFKFMSG